MDEVGISDLFEILGTLRTLELEVLFESGAC